MQWEDPPERKRPLHRGKVSAWVAELRANPGKWARWEGSAAAVPQWANRNHSYSEGLELAYRAIDGKTHVWARWQEEPAPAE